jgi:hypothetical protein
LFYLTLLDSTSFGGLLLPNYIVCIIICAPSINPCQKWWEKVLEIKGKKLTCWPKLFCMHSWRVQYFPLQGRFFILFLVPNAFSSCSHEVPHILKLLSKTFPLTPHIYPIWFAQSSIFMYIKWKGGS